MRNRFNLSSPFAGLTCSLLSAAAYGMLPIFIKLALATGLSSLEVMQLRYTFSTLIVLGSLLVFKPSVLKVSWNVLWVSFLLSTCLDQVTSLQLSKSLEYLSAATSTLIFYVYPAIVTVLCAVMYRKPVSARDLLSIAIVFGGCCLILYTAFMQACPMRGVVHALLAAATFSVYLALLQAVVTRFDPLQITLYVMMFTAILFNVRSGTAVYFTIDTWQITLGFLLGLVPTALAVSLLFFAIRITDSAYVSLCSSIEPGVTVIAAFFCLGETVIPLQMAGMVLVMVGVAVKNLNLFHHKNTSYGHSAMN